MFDLTTWLVNYFPNTKKKSFWLPCSDFYQIKCTNYVSVETIKTFDKIANDSDTCFFFFLILLLISVSSFNFKKNWH